MTNRKNSKNLSAKALEQLKQIFTHPDLTDDDDDDDHELVSNKLPTNSEEWLASWEDVLEYLLYEDYLDESVPSSVRKASFIIQDFNRSGSLIVTINGLKNKFRVALNVDFLKHSLNFTCSCLSRSGQCDHKHALLVHLLKQIRNRSSSFYTQVAGPGYAQSLEERKKAELIKQISTVAQQSRRPTIVSTEVDRTTELERLVWNLQVIGFGEYAYLKIHPLIQKEMKRGGWTKGRELSIEKFMALPGNKMSPLDRRIADAIPRGRYSYYNNDLDLDVTLRLLAGTNVVNVNKEPGTLELEELEFEVVEEGQMYRLISTVSRYLSDSNVVGTVHQIKGGFVILRDALKQAIFIPTTLAMAQLCTRLIADGLTFKKGEEEDLVKQLRPLQNVCSVRLPKNVIDEERQIQLEPTLLLQMQKQGSLDVTVCSRDAAGILTLPGEGLGRESITENGKTIQLVRDLSSEIKVARELTRDLGLEQVLILDNYRYRIENHETIFKFLARVGELSSQNRMKAVWHKASLQRFDVLGQLSAKNVQVRIERKRDWFGLEGSCRIGNEDISLKDLLSGIRGQSMNGLVEIQPGKWAMIADDLRKSLQRLADVSHESRSTLRLDDSAALTLSAMEDVKFQMESDKAWDKALQRVRDVKEINPDPPAALNCDLREYQVDGFRWMCRLAAWGVGGILADDMGLGKTVQTLALLVQRVESGPALVIAPTSLGFNWVQESERFAPSLNTILFRESDRAELIKNVSEGDVIICSYGLALREAKLLKSIKWGTLVLDEAQNIKNSNSKTAKEIKQFRADWKVALTGTPVENHLGELWSLFQGVAPGVLGGWEQFRKRFATPIEKNHDKERCEALAQVISPFVLRRTKKAVLSDLPDRNETNLFVELSNEERKRYDQMRLVAITELDELSTEEFSQDQRFRILQILTRLRQLSCHVGLVDETWEGSSAKLDLLMEKLQELKECGSRPLIFSQFTSHLALIRAACDAQGITYQYLDGQTTPNARQKNVEKFQNGEGDAFLISLKAGGTGLNLTAADYVIHMDPWWNPAVEDQATDRAHRIGQTKNVMVYRIIAKGTIEEQILKLHEDKRDLVEGVLSGSEAAGRLSSEQLAEMIRWGTAGASVGK